MARYLFLILLACAAAGNPFRGAIAESSPNDAVKDIARQNPLIADVIRTDPDALHSLLRARLQRHRQRHSARLEARRRTSAGEADAGRRAGKRA